MMVGAQIQRDKVPKSWAREDRQPLGALPDTVWWHDQPGLLPLLAARLLAPTLRPSPFQLLPGLRGWGRGRGSGVGIPAVGEEPRTVGATVPHLLSLSLWLPPAPSTAAP